MCYDYLLKDWEKLRKKVPFSIALDSYVYYNVFPDVSSSSLSCPLQSQIFKDCIKLLDDYYFNKDFKYYRFDEVLDCDIKFFLNLKEKMINLKEKMKKGGE